MRKLAGGITLVLAIILFFTATSVKIPDTYISSYRSRSEGGMVEYVGGDAYNFIIEAGLRGGEIAGATTAKALYYVGAAVLTALGLLMLCDPEDKRKATNTEEKKSVSTPVHELPTAQSVEDAEA